MQTPDGAHFISQIDVVALKPENRVSGYQEAVILARDEAARRFGEYLLVSWYDKERDFESPPNTTECPKACQKNGYIFYGLSHGAKLKVDIENGWFVFFFAPVEY